MAALDRRRIAGLVLLFGGTAAVLAMARPAAMFVEREWTAFRERPNPIVATDAETAEILRAVIDANQDDYGLPDIPPPPPPEPPSKPGHARVAPAEPIAQAEAKAGEDEKPEPRDLILDDRTIDYCPAPAPEEGPHDCRKWSAGEAAWLPGVPQKLRRELELASRTERTLSDPHLPNVRLVSRATLDSMRGGDFWKAFYERFPGTAGTLHITLPVLSEDRSTALIYVAQGCDGLCGTGMVHLLQRTSGGWKQIRRWMIWIS